MPALAAQEQSPEHLKGLELHVRLDGKIKMGDSPLKQFTTKMSQSEKKKETGIHHNLN